ADGPRTSRDIWTTAQKAGHTVGTLRRARKDLGITCRPVYQGDTRISYWLLFDQKLPRDPNDELDRFWEEWQQKDPAPTPFDSDEEEGGRRHGTAKEELDEDGD